jgi:hypothetical protein
MWCVRYYCFVVFFLICNIKSFCLYDKWIVVTTIQYPTSQLKKLATIEGWHLLVVGDKKTPTDWYLDNCEYLDPVKQINLGYKIADLLPWNHYSRKNIGYLYAIEHGANIIYDTDDDNIPLNGLQPLNNVACLPLLTSSDYFINIYAYFGRPYIWPRGYPLEVIRNSSAYKELPAIYMNIGVEQGMVNEDPDVDAIFRLTQHHENDVFFVPKSSCGLSFGIFCPFNSQNTFFHKKAFFTLYLPSTVSMRVSDIWRSYYAQKLLNDINLRIVFSGPNAIQKRNEHNLMHDFVLEQDLYSKTMDLVNFLRKWDNPALKNSVNAMTILFEDLISRKFFTGHELALCKAWLEDLAKIGYQSNE